MLKGFHKDVLSLCPGAELQINSVVLYRNEAALITDMSSEKKQVKLLIQTESGKKVSVRPKDIYLLSNKINIPLTEITKLLCRSELEDGWQLLLEIGRHCSLMDIAEAVFSGNGVQELYNAFCLINQTPYFKGQPFEIVVRSSEEVREELERKQRKQQEEQQWQSFYRHYQNGQYSEEDRDFITEIEEIAFNERQTCRLFREIKLEPTPENAHEWLLRQQLWDERFNPYPRRNEINLQPPKLKSLLSPEELAPWQQLIYDYQVALSNFPTIDFPAESAETENLQAKVSPTILQKLQQALARFCDTQPLNYPPQQDAKQIQEQREPKLNFTIDKPLLEQSPNNTGRWRSEHRRDLTHLAAWAIDDPWSSDPDDAISLEYGENGAEILWVHIADPASLLPFGSTLANEAMQRGATVYLPEKTIPMLSKELVQILGLGLQSVSIALSVQMRIIPATNNELEQTVEILDLCCSWIQVQRLSYEQADHILDSERPHPLQQIKKLCQTHEQLRKNNRSMQFNMYNTKIVIGETIAIEPLPDTPSRNLVAEAMLMTGAAMALFAHERQLSIPFLCQAPPKENLPPLNSMANIFLARKSMNPSTVRSKANSHSSIGVPMYTRGTSPLRRYLDLLTHQQFHALFLVNQNSISNSNQAQQIQSQQTNEPVRFFNNEELLYNMTQAELAVQRINRTQRYSQQHWKMLYLKQEGKKHLYNAIVLEIRDSQQNSNCKAICSLPEIGLEVIIFSKEPLKLNQEIQLSLKSIRLNLREAHLQIVSQ